MNLKYKSTRHFRNQNRLLVGAFLLYVAAMSGCTKKFESFNQDNTGLLASAVQITPLFPPIFASIYGEEGNYQLDQNLNADCYAGYMMSPDPFKGNINNLSYFLIDGWNQQAFIDAYTLTVGPVNFLAQKGVPTTNPDLWAVALILEVEVMDRVTDKWGALPLSKAGTSLTSTPYDSQQSLYNQFFAKLDTATSNLQTYIAANPGSKPLGANDWVFGGDYTEWIKFANSLRLRLAMHIVKIDPTTAQAQAVKALGAAGGLMTTPTDDAGISNSGYHNPIGYIATSWTDISMGASLESILSGYSDPRLPVYYAQTTDPSIGRPYAGIRVGAAVTAKPGYSGFSIVNVNAGGACALAAPMIMMNAAEVYFLKAEAALRGWPGFGTAQANYEQGIQTSFTQWGVSSVAAAYIANNTSTPTAYTDPKNSANSSPAVESITIAWDPAATQEQALERIITQKWIAMFPEGQEAWTEFRRTGYPHLFTVANNNSGGLISTATQIRRLAYPLNEYTTNTAAVTAAVSAMGGPDNGGTRIWWDVSGGNF
jgi:hypothetical protein